MSGRPPETATSEVDLATVSAVADLVIHLSIALRSNLIYGATHPMAQHGAAHVRESLQRAIELQHPISIHFTATAVFCGPHCLERGHPIFRALAERMWRCGVASLTFDSGATVEEVALLLEAVGQATRFHATRAEAERILTAAPLEHVRVQFLRKLLTFEARDQAGPVDRKAQEKVWEDLMRQVAAAAAVASVGHAAQPAEEPLPVEEGEAPAQDYADAVIDYMKRLQREAQQDSMLQQTETGRKISDLMAHINPELRHQLLASAVAAPEVTPELLERLRHMMGNDQMLDSLRRLNESGQALPPSALRTLTMVSSLVGEGPAAMERLIAAAPAGAPQRTPEETQRILDGLLGEDEGASYMTPVHDRLVATTDRRAQLRVLRPAPGGRRFTLPEGEVESHFVHVGSELLAAADLEPELAASLSREGQRAFLRFVDGSSMTHLRESMRLAEKARDAAGEEAAPLVWTTDEVLEPLSQRLAGHDRTDAEAAAELMVEIGEPAIPVLLRVLSDGESIPARKRAIEALAGMRVDPAPHLLPLLEPGQLWYLQRNALVVLRRRRDARALAASKQLWPGADGRLKLEILRYVVELGDRERFRMIQEAVADRSPDLSLAAMRMAVTSGDGPTFTAVLRLADATPALEVGGPFHLDVLRLLAQAPDPAGRRYVERVTERRKPLMPWLRERFRQDVEALLRETG